MTSIFVILDSSALIAQINIKDLWHQKANTISEFIERTDRKVILPAEVLAETLNRIGNNIGRQDAVLAGKALLEQNETGDMLITYSNTDILTATLHLLIPFTPVGDIRDMFAIEQIFPCGRPVETTKDVHQSRFAGAGLPDDRDEFARLDIK